MISARYLDACRKSLLSGLLIITFLVASSFGGCPSVCQCKWRDGKETVTCHDANFIDIPKGLDKTTQVLDLRNMYMSNPQIMQQIEPMVVEQKAVEWLLENGKSKSKKVSFTKYMNP